MSRSAYVCHERKLVVFWSPKAACTAVVRWFVHNILQNQQVDRDRRGWLISNSYQCSWEEAYLLVQNSYKSVLFTRAPVSRIVSAFIDKFYVHGGLQLLSYDQLEIFSQQLLHKVYPGKNEDQIISAGLSFTQFIDAVQAQVDMGVRPNSHWDSQFPCENERHGESIPKFDYVVRQESFSQDLVLVNKALGLNDYFPERVNASKFPMHYKVVDGFLGEFKTHQLHAQNIHLKVNNLINDELLLRINRLYQEDFNLLDSYYS
jgi:hypothetical protein